MPFICLADPNIPDGVVQILDLSPNESQKNNSLDLPGQTKYVNRVQNDLGSVHNKSGTVVRLALPADQANLRGLGAYLIDKVEPGGREVASANITFTGAIVADTNFIIKNLYFKSQAGANPANWVGVTGAVGNPFLFGVGAGANDAAANLTLCVNDAVAKAALAASVGGVNNIVNVNPVATNPGAPSAVVTLSAWATVGAAPQTGPDGDFSIGAGTQSTGVTLPTILHAARAHELWTEAHVTLAMAAILARLDAGTSDMNLSNINTSLNGAVGAELTTLNGSHSVGTVIELLSILAGRGYEVPFDALKFTAVSPSSADTAHVWSNTVRGSFTYADLVRGTALVDGEWVPTVIGGDTVNLEYKPIRYTVEGTEFIISTGQGQLAHFAAGVTLFPDSSLTAFVPTWYQPGPQTAQADSSRVVTVYADDGTLIV